MKKILLSFILFFGVFVFSIPVSAIDAYKQGVEAYRKSDYPSAVAFFSKAPDSPSKFYNLGNCYYKLDSIGMSVYYFQKAKKLLGDDPDLINNLQMANAKTTDKMDPPAEFFLLTWVRKVMLFFPVWFFPWMSLLASFAASVFFVFFFRSQKQASRKAHFLLTLLSVIILIGSVVFSFARQAVVTNPTGVVIISSSASVLNEPLIGATELFVFHEGSVLIFESQEPGWVQVRLPGGNSGFIREQQVRKF